jgi:hypothetical protein
MGEIGVNTDLSSMDSRGWAFFYHDQGFCVLPGEEWDVLRGLPQDERERKAKHPVVKWKLYQSERPGRELLEAWFPPGIKRNVLFALGKPSGGVVALDFDDEGFYKKYVGDTTCKTWVAKSGRPGRRHVYIRSKKPVRNRKVIYDGRPVLEVLAGGRVVVAPPSLHHSGAHYEWLTDVKTLPIMEVEDLDSILDQWLESLGIKPYKHEGCMEDVADRLKGRPYGGVDPPCIKRILEGVEEGRRNESAIRLACYLLRLKRLSPEEALSRLLDWNRRNKPPLPDMEIRYVIKSAIKGLYPYGCRSMVELGFCDPGDKYGCPLKPRFEIIPLKRLVEEAKPIEYICKPLLPKRALVLLAGKAGVGKSFISLHIAHAIASSSKVFDHFDAEGSKVLIIDEENNPSCYKQRVEAMGLNPLDNIDCMSLSGFKLDNHRHLEFLDKILESNGYKLVVMDCWTNLVANIDENKAVEVSSILSALRRIAYERDCTFLLIHHLRKNLPYLVNEIDELRGSSTLVNEPDMVYLIQMDDTTGQRLIKTIKARYGGEVAFRLAFKEEDGKLTIKWMGDIEAKEAEPEVVKCAKIIIDYLALKGIAKRAEIVKATQGFPARTIDRALKYLLIMGAIERVKRGVYKLKSSVSPNLPDYYNNTGKTGECTVCNKPGGKPHVTDKGVVYLHDECKDKYKGRL